MGQVANQMAIESIYKLKDKIGKKNMAIGILIVAIVILGVWLVSRPPVLGNMKQSFTEATTGSSDFAFEVEAGDTIKISFSSKIESGDLDIFLYDSKGNVVYKLDKAKALVTYYTFENTDVYTMVAENSNFIGKFKVKVWKE